MPARAVPERVAGHRVRSRPRDRGSERQMGKQVDDGWSRLARAMSGTPAPPVVELGRSGSTRRALPAVPVADRERPAPGRRCCRSDGSPKLSTRRRRLCKKLHCTRRTRTHDRPRPRRAGDRHHGFGWRWQLPFAAGRRRPGPLDRVRRSPFTFSTCSSTTDTRSCTSSPGVAEVEVDGVVTALAAGDWMAYASRSPHRFRSVGIGVARVLLVETARDDHRDRGRNDGRDAECTDHATRRAGAHVVTRTARGRRTVQPAGRPGRSGGDDTMS